MNKSDLWWQRHVSHKENAKGKMAGLDKYRMSHLGRQSALSEFPFWVTLIWLVVLWRIRANAGIMTRIKPGCSYLHNSGKWHYNFDLSSPSNLAFSAALSSRLSGPPRLPSPKNVSSRCSYSVWKRHFSAKWLGRVFLMAAVMHSPNTGRNLNALSKVNLALLRFESWLTVHFRLHRQKGSCSPGGNPW